jgi:hypothetical protein
MKNLENMHNQLLLPNRLKLIGWFILIPATILGVISTFTTLEPSWLNFNVFSIFCGEVLDKTAYFGFEKANIANTLIGAGFIVGAMFVGFSKEKREDEFISKLRLSSLLWAVWVNYALLFLAFIFIYGLAFLTVMVYNMFTVLIIFIVRFNYMLYKNSKIARDEK